MLLTKILCVVIERINLCELLMAMLFLIGARYPVITIQDLEGEWSARERGLRNNLTLGWHNSHHCCLSLMMKVKQEEKEKKKTK